MALKREKTRGSIAPGDTEESDLVRVQKLPRDLEDNHVKVKERTSLRPKGKNGLKFRDQVSSGKVANEKAIFVRYEVL